jgi:hypothetical protein
MKIHETTKADGTLAPISLLSDDGVIGLVSDEDHWPLPAGALDAVMARFGKPLEPSERLSDVDAIDLGEGRRLRHVRHLALYDVIALDYLVYEVPEREPLCALATTVAGALAHLGRAARSANAMDPLE